MLRHVMYYKCILLSRFPNELTDSEFHHVLDQGPLVYYFIYIWTDWVYMADGVDSPQEMERN